MAIGAVAIKLNQFADRQYFAGFTNAKCTLHQVLSDFLRWLQRINISNYLLVTDGNRQVVNLRQQCSVTPFNIFSLN